jgi:hypothetical protein
VRGYRHSKIILLTSAVVLGLMILVVILSIRANREPRQFDVQDRSFHFTFCATTSGTNRTVFSGNELLGRLNRMLIRHGIHRISHDQMYTVPATGNEPVLTLGYRRDGDSLKMDKNGVSYPIVHLLDVVLVQPGGERHALLFRGGGYVYTSKEYFNNWTLPDRLTNVLDCQLILSSKGDGTQVATCRLQPRP